MCKKDTKLDKNRTDHKKKTEKTSDKSGSDLVEIWQQSDSKITVH